MFKRSRLVEEYERAAADIRRPSREHFDGALEMRELVRYATLAASSHNTQPWKFKLDGNVMRSCRIGIGAARQWILTIATSSKASAVPRRILYTRRPRKDTWRMFNSTHMLIPWSFASSVLEALGRLIFFRRFPFVNASGCLITAWLLSHLGWPNWTLFLSVQTCFRYS